MHFFSPLPPETKNKDCSKFCIDIIFKGITTFLRQKYPKLSLSFRKIPPIFKYDLRPSVYFV